MVKLLPFVSRDRECGSCTRCCEGYMYANIEGRELRPGKPCIFLKVNEGCGRYDTRPYYPCASFKCAWLENKKIPDEYSPLSSGVIISMGKVHEYEYALLIAAPNDPTEEMIDWAEEFYGKQNISIVFKSGDKFDYRGLEEFGSELRNHGII